MLVAQISDPHILAPGDIFSGRVDTAAGLRAAVDALNAMEPAPDLVLATGDLVNDATAEQYAHLHELLQPLSSPLLAVPGNHDDRTGYRSVFTSLGELRPSTGGEQSAGAAEQVRFVRTVGDITFVALDTTVPGAHHGRLGTAQLEWLDHTLAEHRDHRVVLVQHHPPFNTGIDTMDHLGLSDAAEERAVIARHRHVEAVVCGHLHRFITAPIGSAVALCAPSTGAQLALRLGEHPPAYTDEQSALLLHRIVEGQPMVTHVRPVAEPAVWAPHWAS